MRSYNVFALAALPILVSAHFQLVYPAPRGTDDEGEKTYPCAGFAQTQNRTSVSLTSFPLALDLEHDHSLISIFLAIGNDVGSDFNHQLQPTVQEQGPGDFCFPSVPIPSSLNITEGTNGTIQVITDGEGGGGLYMCADVTFTSQAVGPASCTNGTGLTAAAASTGTLANGTLTTNASTTSSTSSASASATAHNAAAGGMTAAWSAIGAAMLGLAALC